MWKTIRAAFRAYLVAIGRHPIGYPLAGALPPVAIGYGLRGTGADTQQEAYRRL